MSAAAVAAPVFQLDAESAEMTVEAFFAAYLERAKSQINDACDDAIDTMVDCYKQEREEVKNFLHQKKAEAAAKRKAGKKKVWNMRLTVLQTAEGCEQHEGRVFELRPRQTGTPKGMCKIGRSSGKDFTGYTGASLNWDDSVSTWHGKFTSVWGTLYYTDLKTSNGSKQNGVRVEAEEPVELADGDELTLGDTTLKVEIMEAAPEDDAMTET